MIPLWLLLPGVIMLAAIITLYQMETRQMEQDDAEHEHDFDVDGHCDCDAWACRHCHGFGYVSTGMYTGNHDYDAEDCGMCGGEGVR